LLAKNFGDSGVPGARGCRASRGGSGKLEETDRIVLIFDEKPLRREAYICLLTGWAVEQDLTIVGHGIFDLSVIDAKAALAIVCVGSRSVNELRLRPEFSSEKSSLPPLVVISDLDDPAEIASALQLGAQGFVPTTVLPELAVNTMTFVMSGGEFFPVSVLQSPDK
jgi:DNA-binding NarL/FixJ family response regulator